MHPDPFNHTSRVPALVVKRNDVPLLRANDTPFQEVRPVASIYHLYRVKQKLLTISYLVSELHNRENDLEQSKYERIFELQCKNETLKQSVAGLRKEILADRKQCDRKRKYLVDRIRVKVLEERKSQLNAQKENLRSHVKDEMISLRITNAYLKSLRQQFLHALLSSVFPITCSDPSNGRANMNDSKEGGGGGGGNVTHSGSAAGYIESTLLSSVAPSSLNQDQFSQLDEAIRTHYLGQGFWTSEDDNDAENRSQYRYGIVCSQLNQPEKYDQLANLIDKLSSSRKANDVLLNGCNNRNEPPSMQLLKDLTASLPAASTLAKQLNIDDNIVSGAYEQSAALSHLSQFLYISSYILAVPLPFRSSYSFFMGFECSPKALHDAICVAVNKLRPDQNIRNLIHCFSTTNPSLGESNVSFTTAPELQLAVKDFFRRYNSLNQLRFNSAANLGDEDPTDWEELPEKVNLTAEELHHIRKTCTPQPIQLISTPVALLNSFSSWLSTQASSSISNTFSANNN